MAEYRTGRRNGRTIYYQSGPEPTDHDECAGFAADPSWAVALVAAANRGLEAQRFTDAYNGSLRDAMSLTETPPQPPESEIEGSEPQSPPESREGHTGLVFYDEAAPFTEADFDHVRDRLERGETEIPAERCEYDVDKHGYCGKLAQAWWTDGTRHRKLCWEDGQGHEQWGWHMNGLLPR